MPDWLQLGIGIVSIASILAILVRMTVVFFIRELGENNKRTRERETAKDQKIANLETRLDSVEEALEIRTDERDDFQRRFKNAARVARKHSDDIQTANKLIHEIRRDYDDERKSHKIELDSEREKRISAEQMAIRFEADVALLKEQRTSLETRLNDRERAYTAEIEAVVIRAKKIEAEHKMLIDQVERQIDEAIEKATRPLREEIERLRAGARQNEEREDNYAKQSEQVDSGDRLPVPAADPSGGGGGSGPGDEHAVNRDSDTSGTG